MSSDAATQRYVLDGDDADLRRLISIANVSREMARSAFHRVGIEPGWRAIDCGCGPIGAIGLLAELVGPSGRVVGVDINADAVERARTVAQSLGHENVEVMCNDIGELRVSALGRPFDVAYTRCFLMHQPDPGATLLQIASLLRPGGYVVAQEPLRTPPPRAHPDQDALAQAWELLYATVHAAGVPAGAVEDLPVTAVRAGLELVASLGTFTLLEPGLGFDLHASTLAAVRDRATQLGVASAHDVDVLVASLRKAGEAGYAGWVATPAYLDLVLRKPA